MIVIEGYELVARATALEGGGAPYTQEVVVLHNHSTHYLVVQREPDGAVGELAFSVPYGDSEESIKKAYKDALEFMMLLVLES